MSARESAEDMATLVDRLTRDVADFPTPGVGFKDLSPLLDDPIGFAAVVRALADAGCDAQGVTQVDKVIGMEARGFMFAAPVALALGVGFVPVRKPGKLPRTTLSVTYSLEYGEDTLEMHADALDAGDRVLLVDDVLATGGTADAARTLVERAGGTVHALAVVLELAFLGGRQAWGTGPLTALRSIDAP